MGVTITIGYPSRKPLVPGKREPTSLELVFLRRILVGDALYVGFKPRTASQALARLKRLGLIVYDEKSPTYRALTVAGKEALASLSEP